MTKVLNIFLILAAAGLVSAGPASALLLSYTDTTTKDGFNIEYILNISELETNKYAAEFIINSSSTSTDDWYAGAFNFKFFDGSVPTELDLDNTTIPTGTGPWSVADKNDISNVSIGGWSSLTQAGRAGFYLTDLESSLTLDNVAKGVNVSGTATATFEFTFSGQGDLNELDMPFQVAYWDGFAGNSRNVKFGQLSKTLSVPEPATMLLLGSCLLVLSGFRKKTFKK